MRSCPGCSTRCMSTGPTKTESPAAGTRQESAQTRRLGALADAGLDARASVDPSPETKTTYLALLTVDAERTLVTVVGSVAEPV